MENTFHPHGIRHVLRALYLGEFPQAKVGEFDGPAALDQAVGGLQVAVVVDVRPVDHAKSLLVQK